MTVLSRNIPPTDGILFFSLPTLKKYRYNLDPGPETKICIIFIFVSATTEHEPPTDRRRLKALED